MGETELLQRLLDTAMDNVDVRLVAMLLAIGFLVKHFKPLEKIQNELIPIILLVTSFVWSYFETGLSTVTALTAVFSAAVAIGIHQQGRNYLSSTIVPTIKELIPSVLKSIFGGDNTDIEGAPVDEEELVEETEEESVDEILE